MTLIWHSTADIWHPKKGVMQKQEMYLSPIRQNDNINNNIQHFLETTKKDIYMVVVFRRQYVWEYFEI